MRTSSATSDFAQSAWTGEEEAQPAKTAPNEGRRRISGFSYAAFQFPYQEKRNIAFRARFANSGDYVRHVSSSTDDDLGTDDWPTRGSAVSLEGVITRLLLRHTRASRAIVGLNPAPKEGTAPSPVHEKRGG